MKQDRDISKSLVEAVQSAAAARTPLQITGGGTKTFYGRQSNGQRLEVGGHRGILSYEPTELVITARAGTPLADIEAALAEKNQMLAFEPPHFADRIEARGAGQGGPGGAFGENATLGGAIACGFSGPRRPWSGSARDFVLGTKILNGKGEILRFGGQVMKNVAGFDVSRLMAGALGTLGVLLEISLKILPRLEEELTLAFELPADQAITTINTWSGQPLPLSAACHVGNILYIRVSGTRTALQAARMQLGGKAIEKGGALWHDLREQRHPFFDGATPLWRLSVPPTTPPMNLSGQWLVDWGGAQRWFKSDAPAGDIRRAAEAAGGHATLFRGGARHGEVFHPLPPVLHAMHRRLKQAFDPQRILNPGRLYSDL
ncbi:MAG: glycolate oxidase subunit GlcE [Gammaproteobacteria bacterium]|nr:glycolate oxidase subunit GlcE [Gammaproteobacteria bacterium]